MCMDTKSMPAHVGGTQFHACLKWLLHVRSSGLSPGLIDIVAVGSVPSGVGARWGSVFPAAAESLAEAFVARLQVRADAQAFL